MINIQMKKISTKNILKKIFKGKTEKKVKKKVAKKGIKKVIKPNIKLLKNKGWLISLIKPQFEIGKNLLGKGGVVKNAEHHQMVLDDIRVFFENEIDLSIKGIIDSPILGSKGNKEFLIYGQK